MFSGDIASRLQIIAASPVAPAAAVNADPQTAPGARLAAQVEGKITDGQYLVVAGGDTLHLALPADTKIGQQLMLRQTAGGNWVVEDAQAGARASPTLATGRVDQQVGSGVFSVIVNGRAVQLALPPQTRIGQQLQLQQTPGGRWVTAVSTDAADAAAPSIRTDVSDSARLVDLLRQAAPGQTRALANPSPLLAAAPAAEALAGHALSGTLAAALAAALSDSGLFYESHLNEWNDGNRSLADLAREPQAQLDLRVPAQASQPANAGPRLGMAQTAADGANSTIASMLQAGVHPDALPVISQQLATLESGKIAWNGEMWPGQPMHWQVQRDDREPGTGSGNRGGDGAGGDEPVWRTRLAVSFPHLGALNASIALQGNTVSVRLTAADPATRERLAAASPGLAGAFTNAGLAVQTLAIDHAQT